MKMEPSKQESVSKQSSILKAPKQRQPLQCVATNSSSSENSPTVKIKRRVSFAKNRRIREFCNEVEPKEGLDDSYEEHDLSNTKSSSGNSTDHPLVISVACEDKENFPIQIFIPTDEFECKEVQATSSCVEEENLSQCEMEINNSINDLQPAIIGVQNKEVTWTDATIYFDDGMDITTSVQPQIIAGHVQENDCYNDTLPVSQTQIEDVSMEITGNLQSILSKKIVQAQNTNHNLNFEHNSFDFTEPVSTILGIGHVQKSIETHSTKPFSRNCENETECFTDMPLEFTSVIPSSTWIRPHNQSQNNNETDRLNVKTMDFTEIVQLQNIMHKNTTQGIDNTSEKIMEEPLGQKYSKSNTPLRQTDQNKGCKGKNDILRNISVGITEASTNRNVTNQTGNGNHNLLENIQEKTNIFPHASMEITEAVPVYNEIKILPMSVKETEQEKVQEKTKIFYDQSMELTGVPNRDIHCFERSEKKSIQRQEKTKIFIDTSMEMTEMIPSQNKADQPIAFKSKVSQQDENKTKVYFNTSMEMTEAVPVCYKINHPIEIVGRTQPRNVQDKTTHFNDNSMEMTEALSLNKIQRLSHCQNQLMALRNEKSKLCLNASMEMTESVPTSNKINKFIPNTSKTHHEITHDRTKLFNDKSMEVTEAVLDHNRIPPSNKFDSQMSEARLEKTQFFYNASMEMTEGVPTLPSKIKQPITNAQKIHQDLSLQRNELYSNKSMEITEVVPAYCHVNQYTVEKEKSQQEITENRTQIFQNKSMEVTETVPNYNKSNLVCNSKTQFGDQGQEETKLFFNTSMEITEAAPVGSRAHHLGSELKSVFCKNLPEQTEIFQNNSMEITEAVKNPCSNNDHFEKSIGTSEINDKVQEKTRVFPNISVTETVPVNKEIRQSNIESNSATLKQSKEVFASNNIMDQLNNLKENHAIQTNISDNRTIDILRDEKTKYFNNKSMDFTEILPELNQQNVSSDVQDEIPNLITDNAKDFFNNSMDITEAVMKNQNSFCANPSILSNSIKDSERLHQYESILSKKMDIQSYNQEKSFHRITTDELNTLCASMNIPTQNYTTERSSNLQNDFISICNDVNVLRDSLQKNTIFQQNFAIGTSINIAMDNNMHMCTDYSNTNSHSEERSLHHEKSEILPTEMQSQKEYNTTDEHVLNERKLEISELKSRESGIENVKVLNVSSFSRKSLENVISSKDAEYSNSITNDKQICGIQNDIHGLDKSDTFQIHNISRNLPSIQRATTKRKSTEIDEENTAVGENSLKRLPSDNTEMLIAAMGFKTELSHPLIINNKTTIKISCMPLEKNAHILSSYSSETIQIEENIRKEGHEKSSTNITSPGVEDEVFDEECNSSNKENKSSENKGSIARTELFPDNSMDKIDEIQPPSFLCSDSFQTDSMVDADILDNKSSDAISSKVSQEHISETLKKQCCKENSNVFDSQNLSTKQARQSFEKDLPPKDNMDRTDTTRHFNMKDEEPIGKLALFNNSKDLNESAISLINEEDVNTDPLVPFLSLTKSIETYEKRDDCIWNIRKIDQKTVAVDFISRSFVTIIRLNEIEKACIKDIDNIEFISRLQSGSKNILLKIVHRLLLSKLKPDKLLSEYKMYEDVLPLLDYVSSEVISAMNFMFDMERLSALNLLNVESERVTFMVSSKKANIILEISLKLKALNEIGPDDINVTCVLGDIRINDIKQLIINIKKDSRFLSRYINDVKDYIMLMEEATYMQR